MVECGMTPMQAIVASTGQASEALRMQALVGTLEVGKEADLLVVDGNPLEDISILADPKNLFLVMQAGRPCAGPMVNEFRFSAPPKIMNQYF
jgi:imidazolonepropionase-like amidohydrolase